ncbi:MAG: VanZ family protein, partial [Clostridia bacterium]|nr:VanZ family protein [Clostridia bacterium]
MRKFSIILFSLLTIFCMAFIFAQSAKNGEASSSASSGISDSVANAIRPENPETDRTPDGAPTPQRQTFLSKVHDAVRKAAHAIEFAALSFFAYLLALSLGADKTKKKRLIALPCTFAFGALYALSDELHQKFVP